MSSTDIAISELRLYRDLGGGKTIVDCTTSGIRPINFIQDLHRISIESSIQIIVGAGFYVGQVHPKEMSEWTVEQVRDQIVNEIIGSGISGSGYRAGV